MGKGNMFENRCRLRIGGKVRERLEVFIECDVIWFL